MFVKKKFGQNFISNKNLINKIIDLLDQDENQLIIEIGPGKGALTLELVKRFKKVIAIEIDLDLKNILLSKINKDNFILIIKDCLKVDWKKILTQKNFKKISIISNLPYYITSKIIFKIFEYYKIINKAIFMVQKEVGERICANVNEKKYNNLSISARFFSIPNYEFTVNKNNFNPIPKVDSAIISLDFKNRKIYNIKNEKKFIEFLKKIFNNKRKTILNNLNNIVNDKNKALKILNFLNIKINLRPENIDIYKYVEIFNEVYKID